MVKPPNHSVYLYNLNDVEKKDWLLVIVLQSVFPFYVKAFQDQWSFQNAS